MDKIVEQRLIEALNLLRAVYGENINSLIDTYLGKYSIPASAFSTRLTPLEAATKYLTEHRGLTTKEVSIALHRSSNSIASALANARKKRVEITDEQKSPFTIPTTAFSNTKLSPGEAVILYLADHYELSNEHIARLTNRDQRNTWKTLQQARKKTGGKP